MPSPKFTVQNRANRTNICSFLRRSFVLVYFLLLIGSITSCDNTKSLPVEVRPAQNAASEHISWTHFDIPEPPATTPALLATGAAVYRNNCASCHGESGAGNGRCAEFLLPAPRDFTKGIFRFKTTPGATLPTDQDLFRTVSLGLHSTGMPPWRYLLSDEERWAVVQYIKTLSAAFQEHATGRPFQLGLEPKDLTAERLARGKQLYEDAGCATCHGEGGYGDGPSADTLQDSFGHAIQPRNFHKASEFKRGHTLLDIALTIATGNNGTPMPAYSDVLGPGQVWDIAAYILGLADKRLAGSGSKSPATSGDHLGKPDVVIKVLERSWEYVPHEVRVRQGQVVRIDFQPTDNGLGAGHGLAIDGYDKDAFINGAMVQQPKSVTFVASKAGTFSFYCATQCSTGALHPNMKGTFIVEPASQ